MPADDWYSHTVDEVLERLDASEDGLSDDAVAERREEYGDNAIETDGGVDPIALLIEQFQDFLIYLLLGAAVVSLGVGALPGQEPKFLDAGLIFAIVIGDALFGFWQNYKVETSIEALKEMSSPDATVIRDGTKQTIDSSEVVPGDILVLEQGDAVPADARVIDSVNLETDESALTGESNQVSKHVDGLDADTPLAERANMVYKNTSVVKGRGRAVVTATGMETEVGDIAGQIADHGREKTPFQEEVDRLGRKLGYLTLAIIAFVAIIQLGFTGATVLTVFLTAIGLAVAAVPEALPAVVTLALVLGSNKMLEQNALVRRISVVETLGSVDVIVTDKTGTLTRDKMTVERLWTGGDSYSVEYDDDAVSFVTDGDRSDEAIEAVLGCGYRCNNAEDADDDTFRGDPTEIALYEVADRAGVTPSEMRVHEIPFSSDRKRMTTIHRDGDTHTAYMKGAPEYVLERCDTIMIDGEEVDLTDERRQEVLDHNTEFAEDALRVLGFARKQVDDPEAEEDEIESGMTFIGLQGMIDPPREEVEQAVQDCRDAGIRVVMATGDNVTTAKAVGKEVGFDPEGALTGAEVEEMSDNELQEAVEGVEIFARVSPEHKVRIMEALQANGHRVAMTGDGVNDAPALKGADAGIAMGERGTDVAQQSSDMVLQDDNFVTIRNAIAEGRNVFDNIREFIAYIVGSNAGEVLIVFLGTLIGSFLYPDIFSASDAVIVTAVMLLWVNLVTDGLPALGLGLDAKRDDIMQREPRGAGEPVIDGRMLAWIGGMGVIMTATILPFYFMLAGSLTLAQTFAFTALNVFEITGMQIVRYIYGMDMFGNRYVNGAIIMVLVLQAVILYTGPVAAMFDVVPLSLQVLGYVGMALLAFIGLSYGLMKLLDRRFGER